MQELLHKWRRLRGGFDIDSFGSGGRNGDGGDIGALCEKLQAVAAGLVPILVKLFKSNLVQTGAGLLGLVVGWLILQ